MMKINRRRALGLLGLGAAGPAAAQAQAVSFGHGVASGDPLQDRVILWTRITSPGGGPVRYRWRLEPVGGGERVRTGFGVATAERDHTVKVDVAGLRPGREYRYGFEAEGVRSPEGRTRTLPAGPTKDVVLAVASCTLYPNGYFNAYQAIADLPRVDAVLHLGDYIYEYGGPGSYGMGSPVAGERPHEPNRDCVSLDDYRRRHAQYKADAQAQAAHARCPWIVAWDDHETANDSWEGGAQNHKAATQGDWAARKAAALRAYYEWMPIREPAAGQSLAEASERSFRFGDLATLIMLETRLTARDQQLDFVRDAPVKDGKPDLAAFEAKLNDPARKVMSARQEAWLERELAASVRAGHAWQLIGSGVPMARIKVPDPYKALPAQTLAPLAADPIATARLTRMRQAAANGLTWTLDSWDGYPADRERVYGLMRRAGARPIVLSGDSHAFWANDLADASGAHVACEFGTTAISSPGGGDYVKGVDLGALYADANPEVLWNEQSARGFVLLTLTREEARGAMVGVSTIHARDFTTRTLKTFRARTKGRGLTGLSEV